MAVSAEWVSRAKADRSFLNYHRLWREIGSTDSQAAGALQVSLAWLGNVTLEPLARYVTVGCLAEGVNPSTYEAPYGQHAQELLDGSSALYQFSPNLAILMLDQTELLAERTPAGLERGVSLIQSFIASFEKHSRGMLLIHNLPVPTRSALHNLEQRDEHGEVRLTRRFNEALAALCQTSSRAFVIDLESRLAEFGKRAAIDVRMNHIGRLPFAIDFLPVLADEYLGYVKAARGLNRKCLVLDADNTLWGGIVGEDGIAGIALGPTAPGNAFVAFQRLLLAYYRRGVILALNSRNNPSDLFEVLDSHPHQVLTREHFAAVRVNWQSKSDNIAEIAKELNIGLDSMVFVDDDPVNRADVQRRHPDVLVVDLPRDPSGYPQSLLALNDWFALWLTEEDRRRGELYAAARRRNEAESSSGSGEDYLRNLGLHVTLAPIDDFGLARASQLCLRTNQFNATTRRYTEADIRRLRALPEWILVSATLRDRFGDSGMIGLCFVELISDIATIDTMLMSCRALGRGVEDALVRQALAIAASRGARRCRAEVRFTLKNAPVRPYYRDRGFTLESSEPDGERWVVDLSDLRIAVPDYLETDAQALAGVGDAHTIGS